MQSFTLSSLFYSGLIRPQNIFFSVLSFLLGALSLQLWHAHHGGIITSMLGNVKEAFSCLEVNLSSFVTLRTITHLWSDICWLTTPDHTRSGFTHSNTLEVVWWSAPAWQVKTGNGDPLLSKDSHHTFFITQFPLIIYPHTVDPKTATDKDTFRILNSPQHT